MNSIKFIESQPSLFVQMVDKLRNKSETELKMLYLRFFQKEIQNDWNTITRDSSFKKTSEDDIIKAIKAIQKNRYSS
jgi:hypothetical protein